MLIKLVTLIKKSLDDGILDIAAQLSYYLILAFFPFMLFILALMSYSNISVDSIVNVLKSMIPENSYELMSSTVIETFSKTSGDIMSVGIIITVYSASRGIRSLMRGLNKAYNIKENRNIFKRFLLSVVFMLALGFMIMFSLGLIVLGEYVGKAIIAWAKLNRDYQILWNAYRVIFAVGIIFLVFLVIYFILPAQKVHILQVAPGALIATLGWILASLGFSFYVNNIANFAVIYGGLGAVVIFMLWIYLTSLVVLIGGEVNSSLITKEEY